MPRSASPISTWNEKPLHAAVKEWYRQPGDLAECEVDGFVVDLVRADLLIEIQTRGFGAMRRKLDRLTLTRPVRLVHPIARRRWIVRAADDGTVLGRRRSPLRGDVFDLFRELVSIPHLVGRELLSIEVLLVDEEEVRCHCPGRAWRRKGWVTVERRLLEVGERVRFDSVDSLVALLPEDLPTPFDTAELGAACGRSRALARQIAYALRKMGALRTVGKRGNALLYERTGSVLSS